MNNYFKIAIRNLLKYKFTSFINLFGLTVGLTCCLMILVYIVNELSYDRYNEKADRIYRVTRAFYSDNGSISFNLGGIAPAFAPLLTNDFPEIEKLTRLIPIGGTFKYNENLFNETDDFFADQNFFDVFTVNVVQGNPKTALTGPYSLMLTEETAKKYFGNEDPMNKVIRWNDQFDFKVTGIYKSFPAASHMHPEMLMSFSTMNDSAIYGATNLATSFSNNSFFTYLLLPKNYNPKKLEAAFPAFIDNHMADQYKGMRKPSQKTTLTLQPLASIHLYSHLDEEIEANGDISRVYIFSAIAFFILLIAGINYMNLSTARSSLRAREIGVRKVIGAQRQQLVAQFLSESVLLAVIAMVIGVLLTMVLMPALNHLIGQTLSMRNLLQPQILIALIVLPFFVGTLAGIYPALYLSSFQPVIVLKGIFSSPASRINFRKVLVVLQFSISIILIIGTVIIFQQLRFVQNASLGFNKDQVATMSYSFTKDEDYQAFRNELLQMPSIKDVARSSRIPTGRLLDGMGARTLVGDSLTVTNADIKMVGSDYDFFNTYGVKMLAGRSFSRDYGMDTSSYIINEAAVKMIGWKTPENAIGKEIEYGGTKGFVIGVTNDFHFESMHEKIVPLLFLLPTPKQNFYGWVSVKLSTDNLSASVCHIESTWKKYLPEVPLSYTFLDERIGQLYIADQQQRTIFSIFSCIAIFIACLGLLGLSAFTISQRVKEIGIRKILGANLNNIVTLLSKDFLILVIIASVIALPIGWWAMNQWLNEFAYRIQISWWVFVIACLIAVIVAFATISFQAVRAAIANPVKNLRTE